MGGGAIRNAAKAAALGGYRSVVTRGMPRQAPSATVPTGPAESAPSISLLSSEKAPVVSESIQRPLWDIEEWELAAWKDEEEVLDSYDVAPRLVFGPVPTLEEAKEATSDLMDAIEKEYFAPAITDVAERTEGSTNGENLPFVRSMPNHVVQAFSLLQGSPEAQDVVASLASDKNVWDAVMKNEKVMEFYKSHQSVVLPPEDTLDSREPSSADANPADLFGTSETDKEKKPESSVFVDMVNILKQKVQELVSSRVQELVSSIFDFLGDFMGTNLGGHSSTSMGTPSGNSESYMDKAIDALVIGLAIAAILVVLFKRGYLIMKLW